MVSIVFDTFMKLIREAMEQQDTRDIRDPHILGKAYLLARKQGSTIEQAVQIEVPNYAGE